MAMTFSSLLLLLLLLPALVSAASVPSGVVRPATGFFRALMRRVVKDTVKHYMKKEAKKIAMNITSGQNNQNADDQLQKRKTVADTAPALIFNISIGEKLDLQSLSVIIDINSGLIWALCSCDQAGCLRKPPPDRLIGCNNPPCQNATSSVCSSTVDDGGPDNKCSYVQSYVSSDSTEKTETSGYLAMETLTYENTVHPENTTVDLVFGCSVSSTVDLAGASGSVGFSRGPISVVSLFNLSSFSYFISSDDNPGSSSKNFVAWSSQKGVPSVQPSSRSRSTPLIPPNDTPSPYLYYVKLTGVEVDGQLLAIKPGTFDIQDDDSGCVTLSTTEVNTYLEKNAYIVLRKKLESIMEAQGVKPVVEYYDDNHLCYLENQIKNDFPKVNLVFDGQDAKMELNPNNYFMSFLPDNPDAELACLTILPLTGGSVLGSLLQMDMTMTFDIENGLLTFDKATASPVLSVSLVTITAAPMLLLLVCQLLFI